MFGNTLLRGSLSRGDEAAVLFLLEHGADMNVTNRHGDTPLKSVLEYDLVSPSLSEHAGQ